jgi:lipoprotein-releasing system permease protein
MSDGRAVSPYELAVALRYTRTRRGGSRNTFISFIAGVSLAGIALGVASLITVLSVVNGFEKEIRARILRVVPHVDIRGVPELRDWKNVATIAESTPGVAGVAPYVMGQALLTSGDVTRGAAVRGIDPARENAVADIGRSMRAGSLDALAPGEFAIVLGSELASALGVRVGDRLALIAANAVSAAALPPVRSVRVAGIFEIGMYEFDNGLALMNIDDAADVFAVSGATGLRVNVGDPFAAPFVARDLWQRLPERAQVRDWTLSHSNYFQAVLFAKRIMFLMLVLIMAVAAFNIVSARVMLVTEKQADIAILRTLGAKPSSIMWIFVVQGTLIACIGVALGVVGGALLATNIDVIVPFVERVFGVHFLDKTIYNIGELPSDLRRADVTIVAAIAVALALVATLYPAWRAARVNPAEALRYE